MSGGAQTFDYESQGAPELREFRDGGGLVSLRIFESRKPVIAAFNGPAVGVGVTMTLPMDVRIASSNARFGFVFARRGIVPEAASSWFLPRIVGISQAAEWCYTGRVFPAEEALAGRLVSRVVAPEALMDTARGIAREIVEQYGAGLGGAHARHAVAHARRRPSHGSAPGRLAGDLRARALGRRHGRGHGLPPEAAGRLSDARLVGHAWLLSLVAGAPVQAVVSASAQGPSARLQVQPILEDQG